LSWMPSKLLCRNTLKLIGAAQVSRLKAWKTALHLYAGQSFWTKYGLILGGRLICGSTYTRVYMVYILHKLSYCQFCVEICQLSLLWQQETVSAKFEWHPWNDRPLIPPTGCKYLGYISYASWVIINFVSKFAHFRYYGNGVGLSKVWLIP